jgi:hypothetical protein
VLQVWIYSRKPHSIERPQLLRCLSSILAVQADFCKSYVKRTPT